MGGAFQLIEMLATAATLFVVVMLIAFVVSRFFQSKKVRKWIILAAIGVCGLAFIGYFGFIAFVLSGNLN
ncbi:MAG: hypothetical protein WBY53_02095 [Acidobacteriaceae bacterium]